MVRDCEPDFVEALNGWVLVDVVLADGRSRIDYAEDSVSAALYDSMNVDIVRYYVQARLQMEQSESRAS